MDEDYLLAAARYIELNPVRTNMVKKPQCYNWSSAKAHILGLNDELVSVKPMLDRVTNWAELLASGEPSETDDMRMHERTGRPLGEESFIEKMSSIVGRDLSKKKPGPKRTGN